MSLGSGEQGGVDVRGDGSLWFSCGVAAACWRTCDVGVPPKKRRASRGPQTSKAAVRAVVQPGAETTFLMQEVRSVRPFTCLNSLPNLDVNTTLGEALKAENISYKIMSDRCI